MAGGLINLDTTPHYGSQILPLSPNPSACASSMSPLDGGWINSFMVSASGNPVICGGEATLGWVNKTACERYDWGPGFDGWEKIPELELPTPRTEHRAVQMTKEKFIVTGN